jgi:hypothetical protein
VPALLVGISLIAGRAQAANPSYSVDQNEMSAFIESGKLRNPIQTSQIIFELGLDTVRDIQELSASEMMELQAAFEHAGLLLGDRRCEITDIL